MSDSTPTSPAPVANVQTQKRPLEEHSSDAAFEDQHDAKRPALGIRETATDGDEIAKDQTNDETITNTDAAAPEESTSDIKVEGQETNGDDTTIKTETDAAAEYVPLNVQSLEEEAAFMKKESDDFIAQQEAMETQPIQSTTTANGTASSGSPFPEKQDESKWLHVRAIISGPEAATLIGKGGENVGVIRKQSGAKCTVSEYSRGAVERILTVSGQVEAIAKAFGLIIRTLNQEDMKTPSTENSKTYALRLLIPHVLMGSIIGRQGVRIREIQDQSGARLNASEPSMPLSSERSLVILGVADAVHIASFYVCSTLAEQLTERYGGPAASAYATRGGKPAGVVPGGLQVIPYTPQPAGGQWGSPDSYQKHPATQPGRQPANRYGIPYAQHGSPVQQQHQAMQYGAGASPRGGYGTPTSQAAMPYGQQPQVPQQGYQGPPQQPMGGPANAALPGQPLTQQIFIPNDMVGAIIGKGGAKINEIRQLSGSVIKINEPQDNSNERLVTVTGTQQCNQMALYMLYQRLGQSQPNPTR